MIERINSASESKPAEIFKLSEVKFKSTLIKHRLNSPGTIVTRPTTEMSKFKRFSHSQKSTIDSKVYQCKQQANMFEKDLEHLRYLNNVNNLNRKIKVRLIHMKKCKMKLSHLRINLWKSKN